MTQKQKCYSFLWGRFVMTANAFHRLNLWDVYRALLRHASAPRADVCLLPVPGKPSSVKVRCRHATAHQDRSGTGFWILTEADLSRTTIKLVHDL
ncbi:MAG: hypothetical protein HZA90_17330 [Verrucomicrobia bacterium]|nr:hypothetical protein [Verrucomicrobiota bacterium]